MKFDQLKLTSLLLVGSVIFASCSGGGNQASDEGASDEFESAKEQVAASVNKVLQDLPPPSEVPYLLMQAGADFNEGVINEITDEKIAAYQKTFASASLNLGVYATDIGYLTSYEQAETALEYMGECQKLAAPVGVADALDYGMISRFEANMDNKDSLATIINEVMDKAGERLGELDELNSAALLLAGSWIEGIYISTQIVDQYPDDLPEEVRSVLLSELVKIIMDQKTSLNDLIAVLNDVSGSEEITSMIAELEKVKAIYDGELAEIETKIAENTGDFVLLPSTLDNLAAEVSRIRASII